MDADSVGMQLHSQHLHRLCTQTSDRVEPVEQFTFEVIIMRSFQLLPNLALLSVFAIPAVVHADTFNFSAIGSSGSFSGSGTLIATSEGGGEYLITAITGTGVTGLFAPNGFNGNDNLLFPSASPTLDSHGFSFTDVNGPDHYDVNIFNNGSGYFAFLNDEDNLTQTV